MIQVASLLLDLVQAGPFRHYTLHNRDHATKVLHLAGLLIPSHTLEHLSPLELAVIAYSSFLHDIGLSVTEEERTKLLGSAEFEDWLRDWAPLAESLHETRHQLDLAGPEERRALELRLYQIHEVALSEFLRPQHSDAHRYREVFGRLKETTGRADLFSVKDVSFEDALVDICASHTMDIGCLVETAGPHEERFPRDLLLGGQRLNCQYCAAILRLADILDFDRERTPRVLFEALGLYSSSLPGATVTLREWQKHLAVHTLELTPEELIVSADSSHPVIEHSIRSYCHTIERELRDTAAVVRKNPKEVSNNYYLDIPLTVRPSIRAHGYTYKDIGLRLNQTAILRLLMGERLYSYPGAALRELIQNAVDACRARQMLETGEYAPEIAIEWSSDDHGRLWLEVRDNGIGMDEHVLGEYLFTVGNCYYDSPEFQRVLKRRDHEPFVPIARFGVGLVSTFMIADTLEVVTQRVFSPRRDDIRRRVTLQGRQGLAYLVEEPSAEPGTCVRMRLRRDVTNDELFWQKLTAYLKRTVVRPAIEVKVTFPGHQFALVPNTFVKTAPNALRYLERQGLEMIKLDLAQWSDHLSGVAILFLAKDRQGRLSYHTGSGQLIRLDQTLQVRRVLEGESGNRVTINGFLMAAKRAHRIWHGQERIAWVVDLDVSDSAEIRYDVSRERVAPDAIGRIRRMLAEAVSKALAESDIKQRLDQPTLGLIERWHADRGERKRMPASARITDEQFLQAVLAEIPTGPWPKHMQHGIAERLGVAPHKAACAIGTLLEDGRITKPPS